MDLVKMGTIEHEHAGDEYTCTMHPQVLRDSPGACPECGMDLVIKEKDRAQFS